MRERIAAQPTAELQTAGFTAVRSAVHELMATPGEERLLRAAVCALAREARAHDVAPERLLVCFKRVWAEESAAHPMPDRRAQGVLLEQMITLCIREYYAA